jgi:hypothetical protein
MKILLRSGLDPNESSAWHWGPFRALQESLLRGDNSGLQAAKDANEADAVLFADPGPRLLQSTVRRSPEFRNFPNKCFVQDPADYPFPGMRGFYPSLNRHTMLVPGMTAGGFYFSAIDDHLFGLQPWNAPKHLFSFCGTISNHSVRQEIADKLSDRGLVANSAANVVRSFTIGDNDAIKTLRDQLRATAANSLFVLCPRGKGAGSIRVFETMQMGRCPVIVSDEWLEPAGMDWPRFSIRVPEKDVSQIPDILESRRSEAEELGQRALAAYAEHFSVQRRLAWFANRMREMLQERPKIGLSAMRVRLRLLTQPFYLKLVARTLLR